MSNITNSEEDGKDRVLGYSLLVIDLLIIILNVLAVLVIIRFRTKSAIDIFILALALMDLVKGFIPVPISISIYLTEWYLDLGKEDKTHSSDVVNPFWTNRFTISNESLKKCTKTVKFNNKATRRISLVL